MESCVIVELINLEYLQIIVLVLVYFELDQVVEVFGYLLLCMCLDVVMCIVMFDGVQLYVFNELDEIMECQFFGNFIKFKLVNVGGFKVVVDIFNVMEISCEVELMLVICSQDVSFGGKIEELMFVFDDFVGLDDCSMQMLLCEVLLVCFIVVFKGVELVMCEKIFVNMFKCVVDMLCDDFEVVGLVCVSEVDVVQKEVLMIVCWLVDVGQFILVGGGDDFV